jgi:predicted CopG family antitoxin
MIAVRQQNDSMKTITLRCSDEEYKKLQVLAAKEERSMNEILRELIRKLPN